MTARRKDEAPGVQAEGFSGQTTRESPDCGVLLAAEQAPAAPQYGSEIDSDRKEFARMAAQAAMARCTLHELGAGGYLLCRWGLSKELPDLRAVGALLRRMGRPT